MAVNRARGEAALFIDGQERRLCLTLGALAELETALKAPGLDALAVRLRTLSAIDLVLVLGALLRGGGEPDADRLSVRATDPAAIANAIADCFASLA
jgi:hypothetical protein